MEQQSTPFKTLGKHLQYVREQSKQTLAEVSGAVEIDSQNLERIEAGVDRPSEDILLLLISYFDVQDREAVQLWELADYGTELPDQLKSDIDQQLSSKSTIMLLAMDMRTMYSDGVDAQHDAAGVTLTFTQASGPNQSSPVAKVGMSHDQAEKVLETLQKVVWQSKQDKRPRHLPPGQDL